MSVDVRFWGVRGSIAVAGEATAGVGGNTSCVEVRGPNDELVIFDAGTGLRGLGASLLGSPVRASIFVSHLHWDHIQGFPFFGPAYAPSSELTLYGPERCVGANGDLRRAFAEQMRAPHFPVGLDAMRAKLDFRAIPAGAEIAVGALRVRTGAARHPNGCLAYRVTCAHRSVVYATDTEHDAAHGVDESLVELARGADVLIYDSQYTTAEYGAGKVGWGHSTPDEGIRLADAAGVGQLVLFHHDPSHDDAAVAAMEALAASARPGTIAAREGTTISLGGGKARAA